MTTEPETAVAQRITRERAPDSPDALPIPLTIAFGSFPIEGSTSRGKIAGRYHAPASVAGTSVRARGGVVLCSPGGVEDLWTYATYRRLAEQLAARGIPVLRFDYHGQGDSSADDRAAGRVAAWKESVSFAIDELMARSGVTEVSLFGLRLGATLATVVASERGGVANLALWAPVSGRVFVRECRAYRMLNPPAPPPPELALLEGDEEAAGFLLTAETVGALRDLEIGKLTTRPAKRVLLLPRDEISNEDKLKKQLDALDIEVSQHLVPGYGKMMLDPLRSVIPDEAVDVVTDWLMEACAAPSDGAANGPGEPPAPPSTSAVIETGALYTRDVSLREEPLRFGEGDRIFGVVTEPAEKGPRSETALILLTIALSHHIGIHRMHVTFGREAAARGFTAMRLDIRGVGESLALDGRPHTYAHEPVQDILAAMDALEKRGVKRFVLAGLCSGAFLAYHGALADPRVRGLALLNPQVFYFKEGDSLEIGAAPSYKSTQSYLEMLGSADAWKRLARGEVNVRAIASGMIDRLSRRLEVRKDEAIERVRESFAPPPPSSDTPSWTPSGPPSARQSVRRDFETILGRGTRALLIFSAIDGGIDYIETHLGARAKSMRRFPHFQMKIIDGPDHALVPLWSQQFVCELICEELEKNFG